MEILNQLNKITVKQHTAGKKISQRKTQKSNGKVWNQNILKD